MRLDTVQPKEKFKKTEIGIIPEEWEVVKLGDIFEIQQGKALSPKSRKGISPRPFIRTSNVLWGRIDLSHIDYMDFDKEEVQKYALRENDLLVCEGGEIGRTAIWKNIEGIYCYQNHLHRLRPKIQNVYPLFTMYWMQAAFLLLNVYLGAGNVTTIPNLSRSRLSNFSLPLPPLPEQRKIAHVLSTIQEAKEKTEAVIKATKELKKSLMKYLFTYGPVPFKEAENVKLKETEIGLIPEEWEVVKLGELTIDIVDCLHSKKPTMVDKGKILLQVYNIDKNGNLDLSNLYLISDKDFSQWSRRVKPRKGDIIISKVGRVGAIAYIDKDIECAIGRNLVVIRPDNHKVHSLFLKHLMLSNVFRKEVKRLTHMGTIHKSLHVKQIPNLLIPLPPLHVQQKIASILSAVDEKIEKEENKKKTLEELFKSMLHNLMTGKVRVKDLEVENEKEL